MFYCLKSKIGNQRKIILLLILFAVSVVVPMKFHYHKKAQEDVYNSLWSTFDESILNNLVKEQKIVLVDITAKWCITCQANKILVLQSPEIVELLKSGQIIGLKADITSPDQDIINFMKKHNRVAIPFNAVYGPNAKNGLLTSEFLSKQELLSLIKQAQSQNNLY
jgi:suppressor for copper-sensitivity B